MIAISRAIGPVPVDIVVKESVTSELKITQQPVEFGADITDHAYVMPKRIVMDCIIGGSLSRSGNGRLEMMAGWQAMKALQETRQPFTLVSGLDVHRDILIEKLEAERDQDWSSVLKFTATCLQVIIVGTAYVQGQAQGPSGGQSQQVGQAGATTPGSLDAQRAAGDAVQGDAAVQVVPTNTSSAAGRQNGSMLAGILGVN
ncbi:MAG TPA: hypothetical protein VIL30_04415 [Ramlibacter sp.]|jgi:hypothetical protein